MNRWYVRCADCLVVSAVEVEPVPGATFHSTRRQLATVKCGICDGAIEPMGRVEMEHSRLMTTNQYDKCLCDERCTGARGPLCVCSCRGKNHGAGMLATYLHSDRDGIPRLTRPGNHDRARQQAEQYRAAYAAKLAEAQAYRAEHTHGMAWQPEPVYRQKVAYNNILSKATKARTHAARMKALGIDTKAPVQAAQAELSL